jgi:hypothetical protein
MKEKDKRLLWLMFSVLLIIVFILLWQSCQPEPPIVTPTPTKTATKVPTATPTEKPTVVPPTPTKMPVPTVEPTKPPTVTPTPEAIWLTVHTGWDKGHLFFRHGPSKSFPSIYPINALPEGTQLLFQQCVNPSGYVWVEVWFTQMGYVYSDFVLPDICHIE